MTRKTPPPATTTPAAAGAPARQLKTYAASGPQPGMPTSLFDPAWNNPVTAARVAWMLSRRAPPPDPAVQLQPSPSTPPAQTDERLFVFPGVLSDEGTRFKGGSFGELHRRYAFGAQTANFHAQSVAFGFDESGRFFLSATVGRFDGPWGNEGLLSATFLQKTEVIGAVVWKHSLDPVGDHKVLLSGQDARLATRFEHIDGARVAFVARTGVAAAADEGVARPRLSRARRLVLEGELKSVLLLLGDERARRLHKLVSGLHEDDVTALAAVAGPAHAALLAELRGLLERAP